MRQHIWRYVIAFTNFMSISFAFMKSPDECSNRFELRHDFVKILPDLQNCTIVWDMIPICAAEISVAYSEHPPYVLQNKTAKAVGYLPGMLRLALETCCYGCANISFVGPHSPIQKYFENSDIVMPIEASVKSRKYTGYDYVHFIEVKGVTILTKASENLRAQMSTRMFQSIFRTWPMFVIAISMAVLFGCIVWLLDTRSNKHEFPPSFPRGPFEGFWWAFVSMTTVGYGDRSPKSTAARLFAVIWILIGITIFSLYTATLTSSLSMSMQNLQSGDMYGKKIGVLRSTAAGVSAASQKKANLQYFDTVEEMVLHLRADHMFGIALDDNIASYYKNYLELQIPTVQQLEHITIQHNSYGIISYNANITKFLRSFFESNEDNRIVMTSSVEKEHWPTKTEFYGDGSSSMLTFFWSSDNPVFYTTLLVLLGMGILAVIIGMTLRCLFKNKNGILYRLLHFQTTKDSNDSTGQCVKMEGNSIYLQDIQEELQRDFDELKLKWMKKLQRNERTTHIEYEDGHEKF